MAQAQASPTRLCQKGLFLYAKENDCIINLPTGAEKICIATMLMKHFADELQGDLGKRMFFLIPTKPLVAQQAAAIRAETSLKVAEFTCNSRSNLPEEYSNTAQQDIKSNSNRKIAHWDSETWIQMLKDFQVAVMTGQIFLNAINHENLPLNRVHSIIFDEAHHSVPIKKGKNKDPYKLFMDIVNGVRPDPRPRIWGFTSGLMKRRFEDSWKIHKLVEILESIYKVPCIDADLDLLGERGPEPKYDEEILGIMFQVSRLKTGGN